MKSTFFNSYLGDRKYRAEDWAAYFKQFISNGIYANPASSMEVIAAGMLRIRISAGSCFIDGYAAYADGTDTLTLQHGGIFSRIDRIVIRLDLMDRSIYPAIIQGEEAAEPIAPEIVRSGYIYDLCVAEITVPANAVSITVSDITDTRLDVELCGVVTGILEQIEPGEYISQIELMHASAWENFLKKVLEKDGNIIITLPVEELREKVELLASKIGTKSVADHFHVM